MGSFLDARHHQGQWLVRIEDLDTRRVVPGSADEILRLLEAFGLSWDAEVVYQSRRAELYSRALQALDAHALTFPCSCSRRVLAGQEESHYPGTCRGGPAAPGPTSIRFRVDDRATVCFEDRIQGRCEFKFAELGDVVVRRRDGVASYQLAVVVDDAAQGVTHVVRGADLLASTGWQLALARALGLASPVYAHLPLVVEPDGSKLAKSQRSVPIDPRRRSAWLWETLRLLRQNPPPELARETPSALLKWAARHWDLQPLRGLRTVR